LSSPYEKVLTSSELDILWKLNILCCRSISVHLLTNIRTHGKNPEAEADTVEL